MTKFVHTFLFLFTLTFSIIASERYTKNSVLGEGKWVKIEVTENGVYKLTYADLRKMGFPDPEKVSVYGYGGWPLSEDFTTEYIDDLPAVAVWKGNDYLLFYGRGTRKWEYDTSLKEPAFVHTNNPYSTKGYYFLTDKNESPKVMGTETSTGSSTGVRIATFDDYRVHERDLVSLNLSGRDLFGESFENNSSAQTFSELGNIPGITNDDAWVTMRFVARATGSTGRATLQIDNTNFLTCTIKTTSNTYTMANVGMERKKWSGEKKEKTDFKVSYSNPSHQNARLDYLRVEMKRELKPYGAFTAFRNLQTVPNGGRFVVQDANSQTMVWDITDPQNAKVMETTLNGSELSFSIGEGPLREFMLVQPDRNGFETPSKTEDVAIQDLHALEQTDMVIIALPFMQEQAERLADVHRERDELTVHVVDPIEIYNEFSSGTPDASAYRRFMKMFYDRSATEGKAPRYLLLFGDGIYDNRGICGKLEGTYLPATIYKQFLLTFQSEESLNGDSYVTDDYFGFMQDQYNHNGGKTNNIAYWKIDLGVGRLPIRTETEARQAVDKIIGYMDNEQPGSWKNALAFVADDGNTDDNYTTRHMRQADELGEIIEKEHSEFLVNKVYYDAYKKDFSGQATYPDVRKRIQQLLKSGLLLINYTGHGSTSSWSDEKVLVQEDITTFSYNKLPLWVTATCDFTRFDALSTSAGEQVFLNRTSGGIALFTTTRVVYSYENAALNKALINHLFEKKENKWLTLGEVMKETKNSKDLEVAESYRRNKLNFILIGDPAMRLAYPSYKAEITRVNGNPASETTDIQALQKVTIEGEIKDYDGNLATDFNGLIYPTVLDSQDSVKTLDNNRKGNIFAFADYPNTLFIGNDKVENGKFSFTFTVPKDITYSDDFGKISLYAYDETTMIEAQGSYKNYRVGGTAPNPETDEDGPEIRRIYLNDTTFVSGDKVNASPLFVADLWDQSGVNITGSSIGHDVTLIIDGNTALSYNLNSYYEYIPGSNGEGRVIFSIPELSEGLHTAEFIVWDIHNNSSRETFSFVVSPELKPRLIEVYATPNPARAEVEFRLIHDRPESVMTVEIRVFDMTGRHLWTGSQSGSSELMKDFILSWDLTDNLGSRLRPGIYVYRAGIKTKHSKEATKGNKLIIMAQ